MKNNYEEAAVKAVIEVECKGSGFLPSRRPVILFEGHKFYKFSGSVPASSIRPDLSYKSWTREHYVGGEGEWDRMIDAAKIMVDHGESPDAAYLSASWGMGQIMGFNYEKAGFENIHSMIGHFWISEEWQKVGMLNFISSNPILDKALKEKDWTTFARYYNGPGYKKNRYDEKLSKAYHKYSK